MVVCGVVPGSVPIWSLSEPVLVLKIMYSLKYLTDSDPRKPHNHGHRIQKSSSHLSLYPPQCDFAV